MSGSMLLAIVSLLVASAGAYVEPAARYRQEIVFPAAAAAPHSGVSGFAGFAGAESYASAPFAPGPHAFLQRRPADFAVDLFTPNTVQQPAETPGQLENYRKALEEEAREAERAQNDIGTTFAGFNSPAAAPGLTSYVNVKVAGGKGYNYGYTL